MCWFCNLKRTLDDSAAEVAAAISAHTSAADWDASRAPADARGEAAAQAEWPSWSVSLAWPPAAHGDAAADEPPDAPAALTGTHAVLRADEDALLHAIRRRDRDEPEPSAHALLF